MKRSRNGGTKNFSVVKSFDKLIVFDTLGFFPFVVEKNPVKNSRTKNIFDRQLSGKGQPPVDVRLTFLSLLWDGITARWKEAAFVCVGPHPES